MEPFSALLISNDAAAVGVTSKILNDYDVKVDVARTAPDMAKMMQHRRYDLAVYDHDVCLATTPAPLEAPLLRARGGRRGSAAAADAPVPVAPRPLLRRDRETAKVARAKPGGHHPWQRGYRQQGDKITEQLG